MEISRLMNGIGSKKIEQVVGNEFFFNELSKEIDQVKL
jgi:hypothetical protein